MKKHYHQLTRIFSLWIVALFLLAPVLSVAADATSFNPIPITIVSAGSGGVPIGTVISWPVASDPEDGDKWLECNGQSISKSNYPELYALVGSRVPNYRGMFLRGYGSQNMIYQSGNLGQIQGDAIRNIVGELHGTNSWIYNSTLSSGAFQALPGSMYGVPYADSVKTENTWRDNYPRGNFDASRVVPTAPENRPVNVAVRYLIKAKN